MVRQGPLWRPFWDALEITPAVDGGDASEQLRLLDSLFADASQNTIALPHFSVD
jgi:hypothetical protein